MKKEYFKSVSTVVSIVLVIAMSIVIYSKSSNNSTSLIAIKKASKMEFPSAVSLPEMQNLAQGVLVTQAQYREYERAIKDPQLPEETMPMKFRDYFITLKNISSKFIDVIVIGFNDGKSERIHSRSYKLSKSPLAPQETYSREIRGIKWDQTPSIKLVIYSDNTVEGDEKKAEYFFLRWQISKRLLSTYKEQLQSWSGMNLRYIKDSSRDLIAQLEEKKKNLELLPVNISSELESATRDSEIIVDDLILGILRTNQGESDANKQLESMLAQIKYLIKRLEGEI